MSRADPLDVKAALVEDGTEEQRHNGYEPTPRAIEEFVVPILERLERKERDKQAAPRATQKKPGAVKAEYERRGGEHYDAWTVERGEKEQVPFAPIRTKTLTLDPGAQAITRRIRLLRSKPEWALRLATINPLAANGTLGPEKRKEAELAYWRILLDSVRLFGPILSTPPKPLWFS